MTVKDRIRAFCKANDLTISGFEAIIGVSNGYVNAISKSIGVDKIEIILEKFPNLNIEWLLAGKGEMIKTTPADDTAYYEYLIKVKDERIDELERELARLRTRVAI